MRFVSIDIETTGLNPKKNQVIELGAVIVNTDSENLNTAPRMRFLIPHEEYVVDPFVARLHFDLWAELNAIKKIREIENNGNYRDFKGNCPPWLLGSFFKTFCNENGLGVGNSAIYAGGKNFASFDKVFLEALPNFTEHIKFGHRSFDPMAMFLRAEDCEFPNLDTCCQRAGIEKKTDHTALNDALLVGELCLAGVK